MNTVTLSEWAWLIFVSIFLVASLFSWYYLYRIYKNDPDPLGSWLLSMMHKRSLIDVVCITILALMFFRNSILNFPTEDWTRTISGGSILFLATGPIHKAVGVARERRRLGKKY